MMTYVHSAQAWFVTHPWATTWLVTALLTALLRLPSEPAWAAFKTKHTRVAALLQILRGMGIDANKVAFWARVLLTGQIPPGTAAGTTPGELPIRPDNGGSAMRLAWLAVLCATLGACGARTWQQDAHIALNTTAHALSAGDAVVADAIDRDAPAVPYATLESRYRPAVTAMATLRATLVTAQAAVDAAGATPGTPRMCAALAAVATARAQSAEVTAALRAARLDVPGEFDTTLTLAATLAQTFGPRCDGSNADAGR